MEKIQETVNIVELTTAYYAALGLIFAIFLGVIVFLVYDKNSLKKRDARQISRVVRIRGRKITNRV